jgi:ribosomal-protein-alanine N-acetyltransferase
MQLQPLTLWDIRPLYRLERLIFPLDAYPYLDLALLLMMPRMVNLKAVDEQGCLVGMIAVGDVWWPANPAWVLTLGVHPQYQSQGLGRHLMQTAEGQLRAKRLRLTVRRGNAAARHLYHSLGYVTLHEQSGYYGDGETGIVMEKRLL